MTGVLLLNASLTVRRGEPNSHASIGWAKFTDAIVSYINKNNRHVVFMLWGGFAQKKGGSIDKVGHTFGVRMIEVIVTRCARNGIWC